MKSLRESIAKSADENEQVTPLSGERREQLRALGYVD
jgi:hypothetical protein